MGLVDVMVNVAEPVLTSAPVALMALAMVGVARC